MKYVLKHGREKKKNVCLLNIGDSAAVVEGALVFELGHSRVVPENINGAVLHGSGAHAMDHEEYLVRPARVDGHPELIGRLAHPLPAQIHRVLGRLHNGAERDAPILALVRLRCCRSLLRRSALPETKNCQNTVEASHDDQRLPTIC